MHPGHKPDTIAAEGAQRLRNVAIIAHIDHGKTTLIDSIFRAARVFRDNQRVEERVMDSNDLERERGITIRSKHCTVEWGGYLINIVDTPGHADFSGEVERVLSMVDSVLLLVDANEGPMPQTRYVLMRALRLGLRPIVVVNKVDRPHADPHGALDLTFDLFLELGATDDQADFAVVYGSALEGWIVRDPDNDPHEGMDALFETIIAEVPPPKANLEAPFRMQVSTLAWSDYLGRIGCGRVLEGTHRRGEELLRTSTVWKGQGRETDPSAGDWEVTGTETMRSVHLWVTRGLEREEVEEIQAGDIVWINGQGDVTIGDTLSSPDLAEPALPPLEIEEPTVSMFFLVNNGPFSGRDGNAVTLRQIKDRLERELRVNVALGRGRPRPSRWREGVRPGRAAPGHPHRGDAARGHGTVRVAPGGHHPHRRQGPCARADGAADRRRAQRVPGHRHREAGAAQGRDHGDARLRHRRGAAGVHHPHPGAHRLPRRLPHRYPGPRASWPPASSDTSPGGARSHIATGARW